MWWSSTVTKEGRLRFRGHIPLPENSQPGQIALPQRQQNNLRLYITVILTSCKTSVLKMYSQQDKT